MGNSDSLVNDDQVSQLAEEWNVSTNDIKRAQSQSKNMMHTFCLAKGINEMKFQRLYVTVSEELLFKTGTSLPKPPKWKKFSFSKWWTSNHHETARAAQATISQLLQPSAPISEVPEEMSFAKFVDSNPEWSTDNKTNFVFFRDHPRIVNKGNVLIQRRQLSGNCYVHGPILASYYIMCMLYPDAQPIDIRTYILRHLDPEHLGKMITHCGGGSSRHVFQSLIGSKATLIVTGFNSHQNEIKQHMADFGCGLVSGFQIERKFRVSEQASYSGGFTSEVIGSHSMVLIGFRTDATGRQFCLLQNFWKVKQFVEVDAEYFANSGAVIYFCKGEITPHEFKTSNAVYEEGDYDHDDQFPDEEVV
jgi:hypothetical protein